MNIIHKLTLRQMKLNKRRTFVTVIGIIIAVAMITAVSTIGSSVIGFMGKMAETEGNGFHVKFANFEYEDKGLIYHNLDVKSYALAKVLGDYFYEFDDEGTLVTTGYEYTVSKETLSEEEVDIDSDAEAIRVMAVAESYFEMMDFKLAAGRYPEIEGEILLTGELDRQILLNSEFNETDRRYNVGDTITIGNTEYTISGIASSLEIHEKDIDYESSNLKLPGTWETSPLYTILDEKSLEEKDVISGYFSVNNPDGSLKNLVNDVVSELKLKGDSETGITENVNLWYNSGVGAEFNYDVLRYYGVSDGDIESDAVIWIVNVIKYVLVALVMVVSASLIANSFMISVSERSKCLGMLGSVGATPKQKRSSVYFEGLIEGIISIPIGIILGIFGTDMLFRGVEALVKELSGMDFGLELVADWRVIVITIVVTLVTVLFSSYVPAKRVSGMNTIEAIRMNKDIKVPAYTFNTMSLVAKLFGVEGSLALKNLKRHKKRYNANTFLLVISIALFMSVFSIIFYMKSWYESEAELKGYDVCVDYGLESSDDLLPATELKYDDVFKQITDTMLKSQYAKKSYRYFEVEMFRSGGIILDNVTEDVYEDDYWQCIIELEQTSEEKNIDIVAMTEEDLKIYLDEIGVDYDEFISYEGNVLLFDGVKVTDSYGDGWSDCMYMGNVFRDSLESLDIKISFESSSVDIMNGIEMNEGMSGKSMEVQTKIYSREDKIMGMYEYCPYLLITPALAEKIVKKDKYFFNQYAYFSTDNDRELEKLYETALINGGVDDDLGCGISNIADEERQAKNIMKLVEIGAYTFIALMSFISIANVVNALSTSMALRRREFAMFKSMGMTQRSLRKMAVCESVFYGIKSLAFGLSIGTAVMVGMSIFMKALNNLPIEIPWHMYLITIAGVVMVVGITMLASLSRMKNENIIDGLRNENI